MCVCVCTCTITDYNIMETEKVEYLKKRFRECPSAEKKIKFSDIQDDLVSRFPSTSWNARIVAETVRAAFPH